MSTHSVSGLTRFNVFSLVVGLSFLYLPIALLVIYSFNASRLVTVWAGFSTQWYAEMLQNRNLIDAALVTLKIAVVSSTIAVILGTAAAFMLSRFGRFRGRTLFSGMIYAPLVMPEVITGLSLLLMFVAIGMDRGWVTITLAHVTFSMCYVAVVVQSRLAGFDRSIEEAAMDLGATPGRTFFYITLPLIAPGIVAGWLLSFTLSLDDLVIASFTTGSGASTLPMYIYSQARLGVKPEINAISTVLIGLVAVGVLVTAIVTKQNEKRRMAEEREAQKA